MKITTVLRIIKLLPKVATSKYLWESMGRLYLLFPLALFTMCTDESESADDKLSIPLVPYYGSELKLDGYYYTLFNGEINSIYFLYRNGIIINMGSNGGDFTKAELFINNPNVINNVKQLKYCWGVFQISDKTIKMEMWVPPSGSKVEAHTALGTILNDTSFRLYETYRWTDNKKTKLTSLNETFYFKTFGPKPDSVNQFIP